MKLGTAEHKELFCHSFLDTHLDYEPEKLPWPDLSDEEARHIVFFVNWITYLQIQQGRGFPLLRTSHALWHYSKALWKLVSVFGGSAEEDEKSFTATGANSLIDNLTPAMFFSTCLQENAKRMSQFDSRLLQPQLMSTIFRIALNSLKIWLQKRLESAMP